MSKSGSTLLGKMDGTGIAKRQRYYDSEHDKDSDVERDLHEDPESPRQEKSKRREWNRDNETENRDSRDRGRISKRYDDRRDRRKDRDVEKEDYRDKGGKYKHDYGKDDKGEVLQDNNDVSKGGNRDKSGKHKYDDKNDRKDSRRDERDAEKGDFIDRSDRYNFYDGRDDRRVKRRDEDDVERWDYRDRVDKQKRNGGGKDHRREKQGDDDDGVEKADYRDRVDRYNNDDGRAGQRDEDDPSKWDHRDRGDKKKTYIGKKDVKGGRQRDDDDFEKGEYRERYNKYDDEKDDRRERRWDTEIKQDGKQDNGDVHARRGEIGMTNDVKRDGREVLSTVKNPENNMVPDANLGRSGGIYIPPYKLARMMKDIQDKSSIEYQRMTWDALRKSINGLVNKVNATNIKNIIPELFGENLIRGRGLFCRSCMKSQMASPGFTDVFAALVSVVNTKFPEIGDLLLRRIILQFQRAYKRNDKPQLLAAVKFIAHLVNQQLVHELIALELLALLLEKATDDSVEVAVGFVTECGAILQDLSPRGLNAIFDRFRGILTEGQIDMRVQFLIESLFGLRRAKFQDHPAVRPELDLVEEEDQLTHEVSLSDEIDPEIALDIFKPDPQFTENEKHYEELKKQMLGEESDDNNASDAEQDSDDDNEEDESEEEEEKMKIKDETETNLINLRRTIYLTIMSSATYEEAGHKLLSIKLEPGQEMELCIMLLECCSQERTYLRFYGLIGGTLCMKKKIYQENFDMCFVQQYSMIHRLETNKLRNVAKFFGHILGTDKLPWHVLSYIRLTEEDTTSSSRIFIKILFQEMSEHLGIRQLNERLNDPSMQESFESIFPKDNPKNTRFSINFFTSIGLGGITESLREYLKNMPKLIMQQQQMAAVSESDDTSDSDSDSDESGSSSLSESNHQKRKRRRRSR